MHDTWVVSDTHFGHARILTFQDDQGRNVRTFSSVEEMDETMIENWNKVVKPLDKVYHLGDVAINRKNLPILTKLNGRKRLILGNHDPFFEDYPLYFQKIYGMRIFPKKAILSHIPIHHESVDRFRINIHGHIHSYSVIHPTRSWPDPRYINACVDFPGDTIRNSNNYTPLNLDELLK